MFKYKSQKELSELDEAGVDAYMAEKKKHEDALTKAAIDNAIEEAVKQGATKADAIAKAEANRVEIAMKAITDDLSQQILSLKEAKEDSKEKGGRFGSIVKFLKKNVNENKETAATDSKYQAHHTITAAALMTTADVTPNGAGGFSPLVGNYIDEEIGHLPVPDMIFMPLVTVKTAPGTDAIWYSDRINEQGDAAFLAEGGLKPLISAQWATVKKAIFEVAERWKQTKRLIMHAPSVITDFAEHANNLIEQKIDDAILEGDNTANPLVFDGLQSVAGAFIVPAGLAGYYTFANIWDVVMAMAVQIRLAYFKGPITAVLNTVWMAKMSGIKDAEGRYVIPPFVTPDGKRIGEVTVVFSTKIGADDILVGDLKKFNLVMSEDVMYDEGYENDDFSKNLVSKKLEAFLGSYFKRSDAGSILFDQISTVLTAIEAA
jgi:HK97 family phage major capsid protein